MGTRSITHIKNEQGETLLTFYRQFDGYLTGHGKDVVAALNNGEVEVVNGYNSTHKNPAVFNGMGCLAAYLIGQLKDGIGGLYIVPTGQKDCWEEYTYNIYINNGVVMISVNDIYDGPLSDFDPESLEAADD